MVSSSVYPGLERKPGGPDNWVEAAGGLPSYIERIAKHLHYERGYTISRAIASAVNTVKRWAKGGTVTAYGTTKHITAKTQALAAAAVAEWEAKRAAGHFRHISLSEGDFYDEAIDLAAPEISDTQCMVALMLPQDVAQKVAVPGGVPVEDMHVTLVFNGEVDDAGYDNLVALVRKCASEYGEPLQGTVGGIGAFPDSGDGIPWLALVDVVGLAEFRYHLSEALKGSDYEGPNNHGYTPHVTRAMDDEPEPLPALPVKFGSVWVVRGNEQRTEIPLGAADSATSAGPPQSAKIPPNVGSRKEAGMELSALLDRAQSITDPDLKAKVRAQILDLAVSAKFRKEAAAKGQTIPGTDSFPIPDVEHLKKAIQAFGRAKDPEKAKRHIIARAKALGAMNLIPKQWKVDLANDIAERLIDLALTKDGRKSYKNQGRWRHGFVPIDEAAKTSKAKGSPIARQRINRLFGTGQGSSKPAPKVTLKGRGGGTASGTTAGRTGNALVKDATASQRIDPKTKREVSRGRGSTARALQDWEKVPEAEKTIRNGKRYVVATFGGKQQLTEWVGPSAGPQVKADPADSRYASMTPATAAKFSTGQLRRLLAVPGQPDNVKKVLNEALRKAMANPRHRREGVMV